MRHLDNKDKEGDCFLSPKIWRKGGKQRVKANKKIGYKILATTLVASTILGTIAYGLSDEMKLSAEDKEVTQETVISSEALEEPLTNLTLGDVQSTGSNEETTSEEQKNSEEETEEIKLNARSISPRAGEAVVSSWDEFVVALGDASIPKITLGSDITVPDVIEASDVFKFQEVGATATQLDLNANKDDKDNAYAYVSKNGVARTLVIDGGGFTFDFKNLAISFLNSSSYANGTSGTVLPWNITLQNITTKSTNYSGPFFLTTYKQAGENATNGLTGTPRTQAKLVYSPETESVKAAKNIRYVDDFLGYTVGINDPWVSDVELTADIYTTAGTYSSQYYIYSPGQGQSLNVTSGTSIANNPRGESHLYFYNQGNARKLNIQGNGFSIDYGAICFTYSAYNNNGGKTWDITYQNLKSFHGNYWGAMIFASGGSMTFSDYTGVGSQFLESTTTKLKLKGKVDLRQKTNYTSVAKDGSNIRDWEVNNSTQTNLAVNEVTVEDDSEIYMSSQGTNIIGLPGGSFTVGKRVKMDLVRGSEGITGTEYYQTNLTITGGKFIVGEDSVLNITNNDKTYGGAIYLGSSSSELQISSGATVNVKTTGYTGNGTGINYNPIYMAGGIVNVAGSLNITGENMVASQSNIFNIAGNATFQVQSKGSLDIQSDSTSHTQNLIYQGGGASTFKFSDAQRVNLQRNAVMTGTTNNYSGLIRSAGNLDVSVQDVYQWSYNNTSFTPNKGEDIESQKEDKANSDFAYEPMSNMKLPFGNYGFPNLSNAQATYNSLYESVKNKFRNNFTTQAQRILFTRIPDPNIGIKSISNDNPEDPGSITIHGYATPGTYLRLWEEPKNGTTSALPKGEADKLATPIDDPTFDWTTILDENGDRTHADDPKLNYTFQTDPNSSGDWTYTIPSSETKHFTANNVIHVFGFNNLKSEKPTQIVLDKTAPTAEVVTYYATVGDPIPNASVFIKNAKDTNPVEAEAAIRYNYNALTDMATLMQTPSSVDNPHKVVVDVSDSAIDPVTGEAQPNSKPFTANLVVFDKANGISADQIEFNYIDIMNLSDAELMAKVIEEAKATANLNAYKLENGVYTDLTDQVTVANLNGLNSLETISAAENNTIQVSLQAPGTDGGTIAVKVNNLIADITVQFKLKDQNGTEIALTEATDVVLKDRVIGTTVDLSKETAVNDAITALLTANYTIDRTEAVQNFDEKSVEVKGGGTTVTYILTGVLKFGDVTEVVEFNDSSINLFDKKITRKNDDWKMNIVDTRNGSAATNNQWSVTAKLDKDFEATDGSGAKLENILYYADGLGNTKLINPASETKVMQTKDGKKDNMIQWTSNEGLELVVPSGVAKAKTYKATINWSLNDTY